MPQSCMPQGKREKSVPLFQSWKSHAKNIKIILLFVLLAVFLHLFVWILSLRGQPNKKEKKEKGYFEWMPFSQHVCLSSDR